MGNLARPPVCNGLKIKSCNRSSKGAIGVSGADFFRVSAARFYFRKVKHVAPTSFRGRKGIAEHPVTWRGLSQRGRELKRIGHRFPAEISSHKPCNRPCNRSGILLHFRTYCRTFRYPKSARFSLQVAVYQRITWVICKS